ncbi:MAG TPA: 1-deoxy-D-xylulose-5-phosphate reductoisomerase [Candidatus Polarisedimenticolia bacterium]|nr:1-deoxy-D-xylulose-5-phosphate reductoisomerase [Candidatus Polarisedimenticolia bacterium]
MQRTIAVLGSTGSIGRSALDLVERLNEAAAREGAPAPFRVAGLTAHGSVERIAEQALRFRPRLAAVGEDDAARRLEDRLAGTGVRIVRGPEGLREVAAMPEADFVLAGIVGAAGLEATHAAVEAGKTVGLANKEALVLAGGLMIAAAERHGATLIPVDSEHNALHQCLRGETTREVRRLVLTASGGPFRGRRPADLERVTPAQALEHPTWTMGPKITIDSATLMNKALEVIEAHWLFGVPPERIEVMVHPQSIVHSMVEFVDGSFVCQLGATDMRHPIQYALTWPRRVPSPLAPLDPARLAPLTFEVPDGEAFPCLKLGWLALKAGGTMPAVLNGANEVAVAAFLGGSIGFTDIPRIIRATMEAHRPGPAASLRAVLEADAWARAEAAALADGAAVERSGGAP